MLSHTQVLRKAVGCVESRWHCARGLFLAGASVSRGMESIYATFSSHIGGGRCSVLENFVPACLHQGGCVWSSCSDEKQHTEHKGAQSSQELHPGSRPDPVQLGLAGDDGRWAVISTRHLRPGLSVRETNRPAAGQHPQPPPTFCLKPRARVSSSPTEADAHRGRVSMTSGVGRCPGKPLQRCPNSQKEPSVSGNGNTRPSPGSRKLR